MVPPREGRGEGEKEKRDERKETREERKETREKRKGKGERGRRGSGWRI
jgi:hypothetical protein